MSVSSTGYMSGYITEVSEYNGTDYVTILGYINLNNQEASISKVAYAYGGANYEFNGTMSASIGTLWEDYAVSFSGIIDSATISAYGRSIQIDDLALEANVIFNSDNDVLQVLLADNDVVAGTYLSDYISGYGGSDLLQGGSGGDILVGGSGNDLINGGGGLDTAVFNGNKDNYTVTLTDYGRTVDDNLGTDGVDSLFSIERLEFSDTMVAFDIDDTAGQAYRIYQAAFNRTPDEGGLGFWIEQMDNGMSLNQVATSFINSAEFKDMYGANPTNAQFVTLLYNNVLHRSPDQTGYNYWMNELENGTPREQALIGFSESFENKVALMAFDMDSNIGQAYRLYQAAFDRTPDLQGLNYWVNEMDHGAPLTELSTGFINSEEFQSLYGTNPTDEEFIELLYNNVLDRNPDSGGYNYWLTQMDYGLSREEVLIGFSESIENQLSLMGIVQDGIEYIGWEG